MEWTKVSDAIVVPSDSMEKYSDIAVVWQWRRRRGYVVVDQDILRGTRYVAKS